MNNPNFQNMNMMAPRGGNGGNGGSVQQNIIQHYRSQQQKAPPGWQQSLPPDERASLAMQFLTCYRLLKPEVSEQEIVRSSVQFETQTFVNSQTKDQYVSQIKSRLQNMQRLRQQRAQTVQNNLSNTMNPAQMGMMGQPGMQGQRQTPQQQFPQGFPNPQLQRPMQASPIPMSQGGSSMGMNAMHLQQGQNGQQQPQQQQQQQQQPQIDNALIMRLTQKLMQNVGDEVKQKFQQDVASWSAERRQQLMNQNIDPLMFRFRQHAEMMLRSGRANAAQLQGPQAGGQMGGPMQQPGQPNQMQNQQMNQRQSNQEFDFNAIANQQIEALRVQDQGQQVVPASNNVNGNQMGFPGQPPQPGQAQSLAQRQAAFQNANLQRQAQAQAQVQQQQQAQAQARAQQQMQQQQAAQQQAQAAQARNANQMLQGQIGGLHQPGAAQSPAMSMLNRPLIPPGQTGPTTPQQQPQAHVPIMTPQMTQPQNPQVASQLIREVQQRQAAAGGQTQPMTEQMRMSLIPAEFNADTKQQLLKAPEPKFRAFITNYHQNMRRNQVIQNGQFPGGQPQLGQPNMPMNPAQALQMGMPNAMMNNANLQNLNRAPGMNLGQTTPNGMNPQQIAMGQRSGVISQTQRLASAQSLLQQNPGIIKATDTRPFPPNIVNAQVKQSIPPDVKTWAQLKIWANQNPGLLPNMDAQKLLLLQVLHFQDFLRQAQQQQQQQNAIANGQLPQQNNPGIMAQVPQMAPTQVQQQPNMAGIQVSPQEIALFRQRLPPSQAGASDQNLRHYLMQQKMNVRQQQQAMMNLQAQRNQPQPQAQSQPPMPGQAPMASRPPPAQPLPAQQPTPQPKQINKPPLPKPAQTSIQNMNKGVKRPNDDDVEVKIETNVAPQAPAMVPTRSQQGAPNITPEQMLKLNAGQQQHMREQLLKAQSASQKQPTQRSLPPQEELQARMKDPVREQRYRTLISEEEKNTPRGQPVQTSPEVRAQLQILIKEKLPHIRKVDQALRIFLAGYEGGEGIEDLARSVIKARVLLHRQINPAEGTLQENLTLNEGDFQKYVRHILGFVMKVMNSMQQQGKNATAQIQQRAQPPQTQAQATAEAARHQLNAANLKRNDELARRDNKAPPAPTGERPPFPIGGQSPSGAPKYSEYLPKVTNLILPEKKRQRIEGPAPTPGKTTASPRIGTTNQGSPDLKRQQQPEKPTCKCSLKDCEYHHRGFDTQAELETHISHAHAKIDDPVQFALESMAEYLDMDPRTGQPKPDPSATNRVTKPPAVAARAIAPIKSGQTPNLSEKVTTPAGQMAATPMARSTSLLKTPQTGTKAGTPSTGAPGKATPASIKATIKEPEPPIKAEQVEELQPLIPASLFDFSYDDVYAALDANGPFTTLDLKDEDNSWALRSRPSSPINTPDSSSKDTPSTRQSDISENDNLLINIDVKDADMPDGWLGAAMSGNPLPLDVQLSADLMSLGVELPIMDADDMMLFYGDNAMMDLDAGQYGLDPVIYG